MFQSNETRRAGGAAGHVDCHRRLASDNRVSPPKSVLNQEQSRARLRRQRLVECLHRLGPAPRYAYLFSRYRHNEKWDCHGNEAPPAQADA